MEVLVIWLVFAVLVGMLANSRGRMGFGWFVVSVMLSPLIGLLIVLVLPNVAEARRREAELAALAGGEVVSADTHVRCPECRELVRHDARKCKHCGVTLVPQPAPGRR